ncbi:MAG TPA: sigma-70 family RNA polymerase sigma factor, partial [Gemmataceae bacterium]
MSAAAVRGLARGLGLPAVSTSDADLVSAFALLGDADAFAALVARHGPTVFGVCRRLLGDTHDAEDAFQAVFLVLAQKADCIRPPGGVGGWLYGVAVRTANKARVAAVRRRRREMKAATVEANAGPEPGDFINRQELRAALDAELARLPEPLRAAIVLCDLHGKSRAEAAAELGCPEGTVAARVHRARQKLKAALARRGLALPAAGLAAILTPVSVSAALMRSAAALANGTAIPVVLSLAHEVIRSMATTTHALAAGLLALVASGLLAAGAMLPGPTEKPSDTPVATASANPGVGAPAPAAQSTDPVAWKETKVLSLPGWLPGSVGYAPNGKTLFVGGTSGRVQAYEAATWKKLWDHQEPTNFAAVAPSPNGKSVAVTFKDADRRWGIRLFNAATRKMEFTLDEGGVPGAVAGPEPVSVGFFPDVSVMNAPGSIRRKVIFGTAGGYVVKTFIDPEKASTIRSRTVAAGKAPSDRYAVPLAIDPSGKRVVVTGPIDKDTGKNVLWAWSAGSGAGNELLTGHKAVVVCAAWSRDGKTIATGDADGLVIVWDALTFKEKSRLTLGGRVAALAIDTDSTSVAAAVIRGPQGNDTEDVFVWPAGNPPKKPVPLSSQAVGSPFAGLASLAFSPDGKQLVSAVANFTLLTRTGILVGHVRIFSRSPAAKPEKPLGYVSDIHFAPDGKRYAVVAGGVVRVHEAGTQKLLYTIDGEAAGFSSDGKSLLVMAKKVLSCDPATGKVLEEFPRPKTKWGWHTVRFSPDGKQYAAHFGMFAGIYDTATGFEPVRLDEQREMAGGTIVGGGSEQILWSPDGKQVVAIGVLVKEGTLGLACWEAATGKRLHSLAATENIGLQVAAFSAVGKHLAIGFTKSVGIFDATNFKEVQNLGDTPGSGPVTALAYSRDGKMLAVAIRKPL